MQRLRRARVLAVGLAAAALLAVASSAPAAVPYTDIATGGPLTHVSVGNELGCQVAHTGDTKFELFPSTVAPGDCGTFLLVGGTIYGPDYKNHDSSAISSIQSTPFTAAGQTPVTGAGTTANPYRIVTTADAGATGVRITETDSYIVGQESYRTDVKITNGSGQPLTGILWRAGDCYLQESDTGFGFLDTAHGAAGCALNANNSPPARIEQWYPITPGASYQEDGFSAIWARIAASQPFANTCSCATRLDNGAGISWNLAIPAGGDATFSHYTTFSPRGVAGPPPPTLPPSVRPPTSVTQPPGSCSPTQPNICISAPGDIQRFGCVRIGSFVHRFGVKMKKNKAGLLVNRVSRVTIVYFGLDRRANGADRKRPYYALVDGRRLRAGTHFLAADVRLKIPAYQIRRFPNRFRKVNFRRQLKFPFKTCPPGTA